MEEKVKTDNYYQDSHITIYNKDCRDMSELPVGSVQCVVTSPPYWGLRKYSGGQELVWGPGGCDHQWQPDNVKHDNLRYRGESSIVGNERNRAIHPVDSWKDCEHQWQIKEGKYLNLVNAGAANRPWQEEASGKLPDSGFCSLCGAWKGAFGLEPTPEMYIQHTIEILREIRRVLRKDGVVFWNIGDSYSGSGQDSGKVAGQKRCGYTGIDTRSVDIIGVDEPVTRDKHPILKPKDLCLIPFRVALAAQGFATVGAKEILHCADYLKQAREAGDWALVENVETILRIWAEWAFLDGWWDRSVIIWSKQNPMPESVTDRPTESHEYILMLTKSGTTQYWTHRDGDRGAPYPDYRWVKRSRPKLDVSQFGEDGRTRTTVGLDQPHDFTEILGETNIKPKGWTPKNKMGWDRINLWQGHDYYWDMDAVRVPHLPSALQRAEYPINPFGDQGTGTGASMVGSLKGDGSRVNLELNPLGRNIRTVWDFCTKGYPEAHFAVFPEKLPEICIKAATPEVGCCSKCGAPWARIVDKELVDTEGWGKATKDHTGETQGSQSTIRNEQGRCGTPIVKTIGWQPTCKCGAEATQSVVLDPFAGAGTTLWVAKKLNRRAVGYEIAEEYCKIALKRNRQQVLGL